MSYDVLIGLPARRIIRMSELRTYYQAETSWPNPARVKSAAQLPKPVQRCLDVLKADWPDRDSVSGERLSDPRNADYSLGTTSVLISFDTSQIHAAHSKLSGLANDEGVLYLDVTNGGWLDARKPEPDALATAAFTSERAIMSYVGKSDLALLLDPKWLVDGRFFCLMPSQDHFLQILKHEGAFIAEFRAGPGRPVHRTRLDQAEKVRALLEGYIKGDNMNTPEFKFAPLVAPPDPDVGLPRREQSGRWIPPPARPIVSLH